MTPEITSPSRRQIAKGAAWAVPAVSLAAAAPSLAASPTAPLQVSVTCPPLITLPTQNARQLTFTITNPSDGQTVTTDTPIVVDRGGLVGVETGTLNALNVNAGIVFDDANTAYLEQPLAPGQSITFQVFPRNLVNLAVGQSVNVTVDGVTATQRYTIIGTNLPIVGPISVALCN